MAFCVIFLTFDSMIHMLKLPVALDAFKQLGYSPDASLPIGLAMAVCLILYVIPRTSILGAMLITGYLGGAVATNVRVNAPVLSTILFPVYIGVLVWLALWLLDVRLRALVPFRKVN